MIGHVLGSRAAIGGVLGSGRGGAAAQWWLASGVSAANCVAAYQPIGAVSLAASYTNLANPGVFDAATGATPPAWDSTNGWNFSVSANAQLVIAGMTPTATWSVLIRLNVIGAGPFGVGRACEDAGGVFGVIPYSGFFKNGGQLSLGSSAIGAGVYAIAGNTAYKNGSSVGTIPTGSGYTAPIGIGNRGVASSPGRNLDGYALLFAIYNVTLTAPQVAAISSAMSALA